MRALLSTAAAFAAALACTAAQGQGATAASPSAASPAPTAATAAPAGPAVPPERAAKAIASIPLVNPGFESDRPGIGGAPEGWTLAQHAGKPSYVAEPDGRVVRSGSRSLRFANTGPEPYGIVYQVLPVRDLAGKALRLSAWIRTEDVKGNAVGKGVGLSLHSTRGGYPGGTAAMREDAVRGTTGWTRYEVVLVVAAGVDSLEPGILLYGPGTAWIDDVALDVVERAP